MKLETLEIKNFRNFSNITVDLFDNPVIVGPNGAGKSNLIAALRLVLDPNLSPTQRTLDAQDFWQGLEGDPMAAGEEIRISVTLGDVTEEQPGLLAVLSNAGIGAALSPCKLTYLFRPQALSDNVSKKPAGRRRQYEWLIFGGNDESNIIQRDLRSSINFSYMKALRDSENELRSWKRSPLRPIVEKLIADVTEAELSDLEKKLLAVEQSVKKISSVEAATGSITTLSEKLAGGANSLHPSLALQSPEPHAALESLQLLLGDEKYKRPLSMSSLGALNILYFSLLQSALDKRLEENDIEFSIIAIEEPEAHLHPHLQRQMFKGLLNAPSKDSSILVTTHSPHIVSASDPRRLVRLHRKSNGVEAFSAKNAPLEARQWDDISRYLDATRSELAFAESVIFVEGFADQVLIQSMVTGDRMDENNVSVCAVNGTHFTPYVLFAEALGIPWAVVTDGDPNVTHESQRGIDRMQSLAETLGYDRNGNLEELGLFVGAHTLEIDLYNASQGNSNLMVNALDSLLSPKVMEGINAQHAANAYSAELLLERVKSNKGYYAQRLAQSAKQLTVPPYIEKAVESLKA
ncbi:AAA family ATPase [Micrococcus luteus]|nr:AAA family ATPase [Micrococcus luteus]